MTIIQAPAGSGKSVIAAELAAALREAGRAVAWLDLEEEDDEPLRFWKAVAAAFETAAEDSPAGGGPGAFAAARESMEAFPSPDGLEAAALLLASIPDGAELLLVLDDFHRLASRELLGQFERFAERIPRGVSMLVLTREAPPLPLPRLRGLGILAELGGADLRLSDEEAAAFLEAALPGTSPAIASELNARMGGWAAGLRLASVAMKSRPGPAAAPEARIGADKLVSEYLMDEVLERQDAGLREFLLASSALGAFDARLCDACFETPGGAAAMIGRADERGLFLVAVDAARGTYRYEDFFRDALRARRWRDDPGLPALLLRAAAELEAEGECLEAMRLLIRAGNADEAARLLESPAYLAQADLPLIASALRFVGPERRAASERLLELRIWTALYRETADGADAALREARDASGGRAEAPSLAASIGLGSAYVLLRKGEPERALEEVRAVSGSRGVGRSARRLVPFVEGLALRALGRHDESIGRFRELKAVGAAEGSAQTETRARVELARGLLIAGRLREAEEAVESEDPDRGAAYRRLAVPFLRAIRAELHYEEDELEAAEAEARAAFEPLESWGSRQALAEAAAPLIRTLAALGRHDEAASLAERLRENGSHSWREGPEGASLGDAMVRAAIARGDLAAARRFLGGEATRASAGGLPGLARELTALRLSWAEGDSSAADRASALALAPGIGAQMGVQASCIEALCREASGETARAFDAALRALGAAGDEPFARSFLDFGPGLRDLLERASGAADAATRARARRLLSAFAARGMGGEPQAADAAGADLSARELEVLGLIGLGLSNREMADRLFISEATVKTHLHHLAQKFGVRSRVAILAKARGLGLVRD